MPPLIHKVEARAWHDRGREGMLVLTLNDFIAVLSLVFTVFGVAYAIGSEKNTKK